MMIKILSVIKSQLEDTVLESLLHLLSSTCTQAMGMQKFDLNLMVASQKVASGLHIS